MAQIIRLKRGGLESAAGATKRAGELLVITASDGITAANGGGFVLVGIDGSTLTPSNKVFQGTATPDLSGGDYDTSIDGIPFYRTDLEKLFILNKAGNLEVKATPQTGGTNIYSSSAQVAADVTTNNQSFDFGSGTLTTTGLSSFAIISGSDIDLTGNAKVDGSITVDTNASVGGDLDVTGQSNFAGISGSSIDITGDAKIDGNITLGGNLILGDDPNNDSVTFNSDVASDILPDGDGTRDLGSSTLRYAEVHGQAIFGAISASNGVVSGSGQLTDMTGDITVNDSGVSAISSDVIVNDDVKSDAAIAYTKLDFNGSNHYSGSAQVAADIANDNRSINVGTGRVSGDDFGTEAGTSTFTGSFEGDGSGLTGVAVTLNVSSSDDDTNMSIAAKTETLTFGGTSNEVDVTIVDGSNTVQIGLPSDVTIGNDLNVTRNVSITGNLTVAGTQTIVDSETVNISGSTINVNYGGGAVEGGLQVTDATGGGLATGSLVWDGLNDYWKGGALGSEVKLLRELGDSVVSGSAQITLTAAVNTGFNTSYVAEDSSNLYYTDARVKTKLDAEGVVSQSLLNNLTDDEVGQLENIGTSTISATQWGYLGAMDQDVTTTSNVNFGNIDASGYVSASNVQVTTDLNVEGDVNIDGNITIGGTITLGDEAADTIGFSGKVSTDILPSANNTHDLGASDERFAEIHGTNIYGAINATNGVVSSSAQISDYNTFLEINGDDVVSGSAQVVELLLNQATDFGSGRVSGDNFGDADGGSTFTGSFEGDGSSLTGLNAEIVISGSNGQQTIQSPTTALTYAGGTGVSSTVDSDGVITTSVQDASDSAKGIASFVADDFSVTSGNVSIKDQGVRAANLNADVAGTGISLNGVDNTIEVDYSNTAGSAIEGNTTATFNGTTNQIVVTNGSSQNIADGLNPTFALTDDVTIVGTFTANSASFGSSVTIAGDLFVQGETTTVDATTIQLGDNILELAFGNAQPTAGLLVTDATGGSTLSGSLLWDGTNDHWMGGALGSEKEFVRFDASPTSASVQVVGADGTLVDGTITDDGIDVSISGDFTINGLATANSFVYADANKTLQSVQPSNAGDLIQWNGSSFVASNEVDGGTF
jgi:hypothetical protein